MKQLGNKQLNWIKTLQSLFCFFFVELQNRIRKRERWWENPFENRNLQKKNVYPAIAVNVCVAVYMGRYLNYKWGSSKVEKKNELKKRRERRGSSDNCDWVDLFYHLETLLGSFTHKVSGARQVDRFSSVKSTESRDRCRSFRAAVGCKKFNHFSWIADTGECKTRPAFLIESFDVGVVL